jgi:CRISPR/Cas system-associated exonuclease Cas4 (RecB family)
MLSKTRFQYAMICRKRAWLDAHRRELGRSPDAALRLRLADGHRVGRLARELWAGGVLVTEPSARHARAAARTSLLLEDPSVGAIFEGAFAHDGLRIRADVVVRSGSSFELVEVKSSARLRDDHLLDLAIQAYVLDGSGVELASASLLHVDPSYVWPGGDLDPASLFVRVDLTDDVFRLLPEVRDRAREFRAVLAGPDPPPVAMGPQCHKHDLCPFLAVCRHEAGVRAGDSADVSAVAAAVAPLAPSDGAVVSLLDVQAFSTALPRIVRSSPHERIPFLWSLRIVHADGSIEDQQGPLSLEADPRPSFADSLAARLPEAGPIVFFSSAVPRVIEALVARDLPTARTSARRLAADGVDIVARMERAFGAPNDPVGAWSWETLAAAAVPAPAREAPSFASRGEAAAAYVDAIDRATPASRRAAIAGALARYGRANLAALAVLAGVARVGPRV